jgi:hypothetical protein
MIDNNSPRLISVSDLQPLSNKPNLPIILLFTLILIAVAFVSGRVVYSWKQREVKELKTYSQIDSRVYFQPTVAPSITPKEISPTLIPDNRILLTSNNASEENFKSRGGMSDDACNENFNYDPPNTFIKYKNIAKGLELSIPYNNQWGSSRYKINPYDENEKGIKFGRFGIYEGCSWLREYSLSFVNLQDKESTRKTIASGSNTVAASIKEYSLKGMTAFMWSEDGPGCFTGAEFIGIKSNYRIIFSGFCDDSKDQAVLESLASSIKLI